MLRIALAPTLLAALAAGAVAAWGVDLTPGPHTIETRSAAPFHAVVVHGSTDVEILPGRSSTLAVAGHRDGVDDVVTRVDHGTLVVGQHDHSGPRIALGGSTTTVVAHAPALTAATVHGSGSVTGATMRGRTCTALVEGSGTIDARGRCDDVTAHVDGSGDISVPHVGARSATAAVNGSGSATVAPSAALRAAVNGSGDVHYAGRPAAVSRTVDGSGAVSPLGR